MNEWTLELALRKQSIFYNSALEQYASKNNTSGGGHLYCTYLYSCDGENLETNPTCVQTDLKPSRSQRRYLIHAAATHLLSGKQGLGDILCQVS